MEKLFEKLISLFVKKNTKSWDEMTVFEQYERARCYFQHYTIRYIYDTGDGFRRTVSSEEKQYCADMANRWENIIKELRLKIINKK